jgi:RNA 2',3'-cyclic 3'-phosphodiesterase
VTRRPSDEGCRGRPGSPRARLFLALDLPPATRDALVAWRERALEGRADLRPVAPEALHVTLVFLGYLPEEEIARVACTAFEALDGLAAPRLAMTGVKPLPPRSPRLFALELADEDGRATALHTAASEALAGARLHKPEKRPFWPHLTLARVKRGADRAPALDSGPPPLDSFDACEVTLYRSILRPQGALYEPQERLRLG